MRSSRLALGDATFSEQETEERRGWRRGSLEREVVWKWKNPLGGVDVLSRGEARREGLRTNPPVASGWSLPRLVPG